MAVAAEPVPPELLASLRSSGLPLKSFGLYVQPVDADAPAALAALNAERVFTMASTTKLVTSLAALDLLGPSHGWRTQAFATGPLVNGRLAGDLVIVGGPAGLTPAELSRWFKQMRSEGLDEVSGRIVLQNLSLLHEQHPAQAAATAAERAPGTPPDARTFNIGALLVSVQPAPGGRASVSLEPRPLGVSIVNDVVMGGACAAWARWRDNSETRGGPPQLWVRGRWDDSCGKRDIAYVRPPPVVRLAPMPSTPIEGIATAKLVASLWAEAGGKLRGGVLERARPLRHGDPGLLELWQSQILTPLPTVIREMNKTSNNLAARKLLLMLSPTTALRGAQERVRAWLQQQGLADDDIRIDLGSGESHAEQGKPRALVALLCRAWRSQSGQALLESLPIAGVDGTLAQRMRHGDATGQAFLKTGTLHDTRALAGYVKARSGKVYAVAALVNHPDAARATPALDRVIEWVVANG